MHKFMGFDGYWFFGHTHDAHKFKIGETRVMCNPRGYPNEYQESKFDPNLIIDV